MRLIDAPPGVFKYDDELVLKTEYMKDIGGVYIPECYILSSGEVFWGGMKSSEDFKTKFNNLEVDLVEVTEDYMRSEIFRIIRNKVCCDRGLKK